MNYDGQYAQWQRATEEALDAALAACGAPEPLLGAMRYSLMAGGKRLRPVLLLAACDAAGGAWQEAMPWACAVEMIHTYSLIHDDLPAMDDDDLRRGQPTNHRVYGEGMAVLAGDGLLSLAFETMLAACRTPAQVAATAALARAAGVAGMVAGQCADLTCQRECRGGAQELTYIHLHKTADMLCGAVGAGLRLAGAADVKLAAGERFAQALGMAFQIQDDLLDVQGDAQALGKQTGMDARRGKLTWPGLHGPEAARREAESQTKRALAALEAFGEDGAFLHALAVRMLGRDR